ncbi:hypothetical protein LRR81_18305 [Metabacillus sp. GX 13764]|uniref:hypothetical protein n=1 Tax=Metabacillus kandeliae TaxID=2900151 RepID=UPI001E33D329|nr:hypothetical protein [Metabacillus kandeliae]MCD7036199.1 hypothetical protein [Metabacillus kandeliae]
MDTHQVIGYGENNFYFLNLSEPENGQLYMLSDSNELLELSVFHPRNQRFEDVTIMFHQEDLRNWHSVFSENIRN